MLKRSEVEGKRGGPGGRFHDPSFEKHFPHLWDYLTQTAWEDGTPRELSSIMIIPEPGIIRLMLRDKATGLVCWVAAPDFTSMFAVLDAAVGDPGHEWRRDRQHPGQVAKRAPSPEGNGQGPVDRRKRGR